MDSASSPVVLILTLERALCLWVLLISFFFTLSVVAVLSRERKWHELITMFAAVYLLSLLLSGAIFGWGLGVPFAQVELVAIP